MVSRSLARRKALKSCAVHNEDVGPSVIIVVEDGDPGPGSLDNVFFCVQSAEDVGERQPSFFRDVSEVRNGSGSIGCGRLLGCLRVADQAQEHEKK